MQRSQPLVSVVIPCYNHEQFVQDSIQSVIDQTYENIELIVIDDGSNDSSVVKIEEMLDSCKKRFVRFEFRYRANIGLSATLNEALEWCKGKYFSAIASDDQMLKAKIAKQIVFLEGNRDSVAVFGGIQLIDEKNDKLDIILSERSVYDFKDIIMHRHDLPAPTQMIRMDVIKKIGGYDIDLIIEDWYMWLKLSSKGNISYMSEVFCLYRIHDNNSSKNLEKMQKGRLEVLERFNDNLYYSEALKHTKWINLVETYINERKTKYILGLLIMSPKKTIAIIFKNLKNKLRLI